MPALSDRRKDASGTKLTQTVKLSNAVQYQVQPFGLSLHGPWMNAAAPDNLYQYSGKELQADHGLGWIDGVYPERSSKGRADVYARGGEVEWGGWVG